MEVWCIIVAGGSGTRFGGLKQFAPLGSTTVLNVSLATAIRCVDHVVVVIPRGFDADVISASDFAKGLVTTVEGGSTRAESVRSGLNVLPDSTEWVLIHDAARPFASVDVYRRVIDGLRQGAEIVVPAVQVTDTVKERLSSGSLHTLDRERLLAIQTPQGFSAPLLRLAHSTGPQATDDSQLCESMGVSTLVVEGDAANTKITVRSDLERDLVGNISHELTHQSAEGIRVKKLRVGTGFDSHKFSQDPNRTLVLCGVRVPGRGLDGHSDADVGCHAVSDAILGASGLGGLGDWFPDTLDSLRNADSLILLEKCFEMIEGVGYRVANADVTLICEAPKLADYRREMEMKLRHVLGSDVCVKAKRTEEMGAIGRKEGIAALATVLIEGI